MKRIPCYLEFDDRTNTVTLRHAQTNCIQMQIKLEAGCESTLTRVIPQEDCDNWWIGIKPADHVVTESGLFSKKKLRVRTIDFTLE